MNKVILIGNLTRDPELKTTPSGVSVCTFSVAVQRNYTNSAGEREADFINITVWRAQAENCAKYLSKGRKVGISGSLQTRNYEDKDGNKRYVTEVIADEVEFISTKSEGGAAYEPSASKPAAAKKPVSELVPADNDDLPF